MKYANVKCKLRRSEAVLENRTKIAEYKNSAVRGHSTEPWEMLNVRTHEHTP